MIFNQVWFYFEFISKSITETMLMNESKPPITDRCFEYISTVINLVATEICNRYFDEYDRVSRFNSSLAFFTRDLIGVLSKSQILHFIKIYNDLTNETIRSNVGQCAGLKLLRARFFRLITFHDGFFELLSGLNSDKMCEDPLSLIFNDVDYLMNTFQTDTKALNYHCGTMMKLQSGIDADQRYDKRRGDLAKLFLPVVKITLRHLTRISEEANEEEKFPSFTSSMILMVNVWSLRTTFTNKNMFHEFIEALSEDDFIYFLQLLLAIVAIFHYKPEAVMNRKKQNASKQNMDLLNQLNKGTGTAVQLLRTKVNSMPRSNTTATLETAEKLPNEGSIRSWKQIRTRGLSTTTQSASHIASRIESGNRYKFLSNIKQV